MFFGTGYGQRDGIGRLFLVGLLVTLVLALTGITAAQDGESVLRVGMVAPENLDPATGSNDPEVLFNRTIYDYLIEVTPDGVLAPNLAYDWEISDDGLTYTFFLEDGVTFHDGSTFSAADVVFTFNRLQELESPAISLLGEFSIEAVDDLIVAFSLESPNADFLFGVASRFALILKDGTESPNVLGSGDGLFANFNGTGPFVLTEYSAGERAYFVANEDYWIEDQPALAGLEFLFIDDTLTQIDALRSGVIDFIFKLDVDQIPTLEGVGGITIVDRATNQHPVIRIRSDEGALGEDVRIRQAFKYATNRQELLETVQEGFGVLGNNDPIGPAYGEFFDAGIENVPFDPEMACALIQDATGQERISTDFYVVDAFNYESLGVALQQQWEQGCIDVNILLRAESLYYADTEWLEVDLGITGWGDQPVPQGYLVQAYVTGGIFNESHFSDAEVDELVSQAAVTADLEERAAIYSQISQIFAERGPIIIPWFASVVGAVRDNVVGLDMHPFPGQTDFRTVSINE